jgi:signal transduction histidine kinase
MFDLSLPFDLSIQNILILIALVMNTFLGILIFTKRRSEYENQVYTLNIILIVWWSVAMLIYRSTTTDLLLWTIMLYVVPTFIASSFLYFSLLFPNLPVKNHKRYILPIVVINALVALLTMVPGYIIQNAYTPLIGENIITFGPLYIIYSAYISLFFGAGLLILAFKYARNKNPVQRRQLVYLLVSYSFASTLAMVTNLLLPYAGFYQLNWLGQVLTLLMVLPVTYAIFKHRLFDVKVIATELLVATLWLFLLIRTLFSRTPEDGMANFALLLVTVIVGTLLIRSVDNEVEQREKLEVLSHDLEAANARLTELDRQKSEFIGIAAHQLRTPIAAIKGYSSLILEGSYGKTTKSLHEVTKTIFDSSTRMADTIADFLNVSRIEQGRMEYHKESIDLEQTVADTVAAFGLAAKEKGLAITYVADECAKDSHIILADPGKIQHVINNLLDNAIKYTLEGGIDVRLSCNKEKHLIRVEVRDTGAGIPTDAIPGLFVKFVRARNAKNINVTGSGLGLYVARQMIEAHNGKIWAESAGEGKGSTFIFELPLATPPHIEESAQSGSIRS